MATTHRPSNPVIECMNNLAASVERCAKGRNENRDGTTMSGYLQEVRRRMNELVVAFDTARLEKTIDKERFSALITARPMALKAWVYFSKYASLLKSPDAIPWDDELLGSSAPPPTENFHRIEKPKSTIRVPPMQQAAASSSKPLATRSASKRARSESHPEPVGHPMEIDGNGPAKTKGKGIADGERGGHSGRGRIRSKSTVDTDSDTMSGPNADELKHTELRDPPQSTEVKHGLIGKPSKSRRAASTKPTNRRTPAERMPDPVVGIYWLTVEKGVPGGSCTRCKESNYVCMVSYKIVPPGVKHRTNDRRTRPYIRGSCYHCHNAHVSCSWDGNFKPCAIPVTVQSGHTHTDDCEAVAASDEDGQDFVARAKAAGEGTLVEEPEEEDTTEKPARKRSRKNPTSEEPKPPRGAAPSATSKKSRDAPLQENDERAEKDLTSEPRVRPQRKRRVKSEDDDVEPKVRTKVPNDAPEVAYDAEGQPREVIQPFPVRRMVPNRLLPGARGPTAGVTEIPYAPALDPISELSSRMDQMEAEQSVAKATMTEFISKSIDEKWEPLNAKFSDTWKARWNEIYKKTIPTAIASVYLTHLPEQDAKMKTEVIKKVEETTAVLDNYLTEIRKDVDQQFATINQNMKILEEGREEDGRSVAEEFQKMRKEWDEAQRQSSARERDVQNRMASIEDARMSLERGLSALNVSELRTDVDTTKTRVLEQERTMSESYVKVGTAVDILQHMKGLQNAFREDQLSNHRTTTRVLDTIAVQTNLLTQIFAPHVLPAPQPQHSGGSAPPGGPTERIIRPLPKRRARSQSASQGGIGCIDPRRLEPLSPIRSQTEPSSSNPAAQPAEITVPAPAPILEEETPRSVDMDISVDGNSVEREDGQIADSEDMMQYYDPNGDHAP